MKRYQNTPITQPIGDLNRRYITTKYPSIPLDFSDIYVYTTIGDRYDLLAKSYYNDPSLWWVISSANYNLNQDSLIPPVGSQIRIPSSDRIGLILSNFESLNK